MSPFPEEYECSRNPQQQNVGRAPDILNMFGLQDVVERLTSDGTASASRVHDLLNIEPTADAKPNTYHVVFAHPGRALGFEGLKNRITLIDHTQEQAQKRRLKHAGTLSLLLPDPSSPGSSCGVCPSVSHVRRRGFLEWN
ncbi:hypothetical protein B0H14DRAFT_3479330 [Mycena olivaceomarginata]|nr:hypothetical protein B0H14DRAFT_3479330 [Mycena olivaceomarginata]